MNGRHIRRGEQTRAPYMLEVTPRDAGWAFTGLRVVSLSRGSSLVLDTGAEELIVLPLEGSFSVRVDELDFTLAGRASVFTALTDFVYAPRDARVEISTEHGGRCALPSALADRRLETRHVAASDVPVELRGAGSASRQVNNFCAPDAFEADRLIAVEVLTPSGNWSSYPPHKHDELRPGRETVLEEIYYYEVARDGLAYQRVYSSGSGRSIEVTAEVRSGDAVVMPHGYHGPSMAPPGYDLYYLNVMAGPGERAWHVSDDPEHAWVRDEWAHGDMDSRLPLTGAVSA